MGVRRAVDLAQAEQGSARVCTLGPLIHNPQVLDYLTHRGVEILYEASLPEDLNGCTVIIRAHGISPQTEAQLHRLGANVIDATCPHVKASQLKAQALAQAGFSLFLAGEESHAEIIGIRGYAEQYCAPWCTVVGSAAQAAQAAAKFHAANPRTALIGQTTISAEEYQDIAEAIMRFFPSLEIAQTICTATRERQDSLRDLLNKVDAVIIAGGKESANTRRLLTIAQAAGKPCALVETAADIPPEFFNYHTIGLTAGASTPDFVIDSIEKTLASNP